MIDSFEKKRDAPFSNVENPFSKIIWYHSLYKPIPEKQTIFPMKCICITIIEQPEGNCVKTMVEARAIELGEYIVQSGATVRNAAKKFGISKSTVHKDVSDRLKYIDPQLHRQVKAVLDTNTAQRHIRGGMATKQKYSEARRKRRAERRLLQAERGVHV